MRGPNWTLPFHISIDASYSAISVILGQHDDMITYSIYYINKNLTPTKSNYIVTKKYFLVVFYAINKFGHYINGCQVFVHTNNSAIRYLMNKTITNGLIKRRFLLLQEFDITVVGKHGRENLVVDFSPDYRMNVKLFQ